MSALCRRRGCKSRLIDRFDAIGRIAWVCEPCERNAAGFCRDCPKRLDNPNAMRCDACRLERTREQSRANQERRYRNPEIRARILAGVKKRSRRPDVAARKAAVAKEWRRTHYAPPTDIDRLYKREWMKNRRAAKAVA